MHYSVPTYNKDTVPSFGSPELLFMNYCDEQDQQHPRSAHSHHDMVEIIYILRGEGIFEINGNQYHVKKGDIVFYNNDTVHNESIQFPPPPIYGLEIGGIQREGLPFCYLLPQNADPVISTGEQSADFRNLFAMIYHHTCAQTPESSIICQSLLQVLLLMIDTLASGNHPAVAGEQTESRTITLGKQLQNYVDEHALEELSIQTIADHFSISQTYASRIFKKVTGMSLIQYIIQRRIGEAQTLLLLTDLPVSDISRRVGYDNISHFVKMFTQNVGLSPNKYRKQTGLAMHQQSKSQSAAE